MTERAPEKQAATKRTRGGWQQTGTAAARRAHADKPTSRKGQQTRSQLLAAARRVFERDGYVGARVADIVAEAGLAHGSFYTYFESKQEAFVELIRAVGHDFREAITPTPADDDLDTYEVLEQTNRRYLDAYARNRKMWALIEQVSTIDPTIHRVRLAGRRNHVTRVQQTIERWQRDGLADSDLDTPTTAAALVSMLSNFAYWSLAGGDHFDEDTAASTLTQIWCRAVQLEPRPRHRRRTRG